MFYVTIVLKKVTDFDCLVFECSTKEELDIVKKNAMNYVNTKIWHISSLRPHEVKRMVEFRNKSSHPEWYNHDYLTGFNREERKFFS